MNLVTGGAGFIGSHLVARLVARGERVRIFDNLSSGRRSNLAAVAGRVELIEGDLRDESAVRLAVTGVHTIFHEAAIASVQASIADPRETFEVNVTGTLNVLLAARDAGCRRLVFASSASIYGDDPALPKHESMLPQPASPYALSKLTGEHLCAIFSRLYGLETVVLRYFNVFGPRQDPTSPYSGVIARFVDAIDQGRQPIIYGDGEQSRDFVYVEDVVTANLRAATLPGMAGTVVNIGTGTAVSLNRLVQAVARLTGQPVAARYEPSRAGDIRHSLADIGAATRLLGYTPAYQFTDGLRLLLEDRRRAAMPVGSAEPLATGEPV